jgi:hypothetical protein
MKKNLSNFNLQAYTEFLTYKCESLISSMERPFEKGEVVGLLSALNFLLSDEEYSVLSAKFEARLDELLSIRTGKGGDK